MYPGRPHVPLTSAMHASSQQAWPAVSSAATECATKTDLLVLRRRTFTEELSVVRAKACVHGVGERHTRRGEGKRPCGSVSCAGRASITGRAGLYSHWKGLEAAPIYGMNIWQAHGVSGIDQVGAPSSFVGCVR